MTAARTINVVSSARLHFGLWAWGADYERQFGGVGMMLCEPQLRVRICAADEFSTIGPAADRVQRAATHCVRKWQLSRLPACSIEVLELPTPHVGFGVGTQLALAVARGLAEWVQVEVASPEQLSVAVGRGRRSAVGTHGFARGGLIVDAGKRSSDAIGQLLCRTTVPAAWRLLLVTSNRAGGMAGEAERVAFAKLPPVPQQTAAELRQLALAEIVPACDAADFNRFSHAVHDYGYLAGTCFESVQGGPYAGRQVSETVARLRSLGAIGVGQSSWGPTVYAFAPDSAAARELQAAFLEEVDDQQSTIRVTAAKNEGASVYCDDAANERSS